MKFNIKKRLFVLEKRLPQKQLLTSMFITNTAELVVIKCDLGSNIAGVCSSHNGIHTLGLNDSER